MKKFAAVLASLLVLACGTTALAAPSADAEALAKVVKVETEGVTVTEVKAEVVTEAKTEAAKVDAKAEVLALVEVSTTGAKTITFAIDGVKAGDNIVVLHKDAVKGWEKIAADKVKVEAGKVTVTFESLSPVAFVKVAAAEGGATIPPTGAPVVLPVVALICAAGAAGCAKKVKFN